MSSPTDSSARQPGRNGTVALIIRFQNNLPELVTSLSDDSEIATFEAAVASGEKDPLAVVQEMRNRIAREDEEFGNYVEELLSQPAVRPEIMEHGIQWLKSKIRIEQFQKTEREATQVIAHYAYNIFKENPWREDFNLASPTAKVRVRVFTLQSVSSESPGSADSGDNQAA